MNSFAFGMQVKPGAIKPKSGLKKCDCWDDILAVILMRFNGVVLCPKALLVFQMAHARIHGAMSRF